MAIAPEPTQPSLEQIGSSETPKAERPIWEMVAALGSQIPDEEWDGVPKDSSVNRAP